MSHAYLIIQNLSDEPISIESDNFTAIDDNGFSYKGAKFRCNYYESKKEFYTERYELHPSSKVRFLVLFKSKTISRIIYSSIFDDYYYDLTKINIMVALYGFGLITVITVAFWIYTETPSGKKWIKGL